MCLSQHKVDPRITSAWHSVGCIDALSHGAPNHLRSDHLLVDRLVHSLFHLWLQLLTMTLPPHSLLPSQLLSHTSPTLRSCKVFLLQHSAFLFLIEEALFSCFFSSCKGEKWKATCNGFLGLYSSVVERQSSKLKVLDSIPRRGCCWRSIKHVS